MAPRTQVNSATLIMGVTGSGKSSLLATLADYVWQNWKLVTLYYNCDGGGFPAEVQARIAAGIMWGFRMRTRDLPDGGLAFETAYRSCQGWWPRRINPITCEVEPGVEMVPPLALTFTMRCPAGHVVKQVPSESLLTPAPCPECRKIVTKADMQVSKELIRNKGFEKVGAVCYDGLSSMCSWGLMEMGHRAGRLELRGEESALGGKVKSGDMSFGGSTRSHVGFVQARGEEFVHLTLGIPGLVVPPVFTALTHEDVDDRSLSIRGPKISGRAKTDEAPQWFGNCLEAMKEPALQGNGEQYVLKLAEFTDANGVRHLCKHRASPGSMPAELRDPVEGLTDRRQAFTEFHLGKFFRMLDQALESTIETVKLEIPDAPGVPEGIMDFGAAMSAPPTQPMAPLPAGMIAGGPATTITVPPPTGMAGTAGAAAPPAQTAATGPVAAVPKGRGRGTAKAAAGAPPTATPVQAGPAATPETTEEMTAGVAAATPAAAETSPAATQEPVQEPVQAPVQAAQEALPAPSVTPPPNGSAGPPIVAQPPAQAPVPVSPPVAASTPSAAPVPAARPTPPPAGPRAAAPPPGRRPSPPPPGSAGMSVSGPGAPRPMAAAPRPPAAAPRPPAAAAPPVGVPPKTT